MYRLACFVVVAAGCSRTAPATREGPMAPDGGFAAVQERGRAVMGVNQYTSRHVFEDLTDGGRIVLDIDDPADTAGVATVRAHLRTIVHDFEAGNFAKPFAVHAQVVPGTDVMSQRRQRITYRMVERPRGGEVRIATTDSMAVDAVHRFLAFQRMDHRAADHEH